MSLDQAALARAVQETHPQSLPGHALHPRAAMGLVAGTRTNALLVDEESGVVRDRHWLRVHSRLNSAVA